MRTRIFCLTVGLVAPLIGCGDDKTGINPDARPNDAPDASTFAGFNADEGGEVRFEYVFTNGGIRARTTAFLWDPGSTKFFEFLDQNGCTDMRKGQAESFWPTAVNPVGERTYLDPGSVTISGGPMPLTVARNTTGMPAADPFGRDHPANAWNFHFGMNDGTMFMSEKTTYDVAFGGSADVPAQTFADVMYMPASFEPTGTYACPAAPCPNVPLDAGQPVTLEWSTPADSPPAGFEVLSLAGFTGANGPVALCVEPNDGSITIPAEMVDIARAAYPAGATLARQTLTHTVKELVDKDGPTGRRIDFVAVWCYASTFTVTP
jgi:hypothetical protein